MSISMVPGGLVASPRRWDFLATMMLEQGYKSFVEVGCKEGRTTGHILKTVPDSRVIAIDPWIVQEANPNDPTKETYESWDFKKIEAEFYANVGEEGRKRCDMMRMTSEEAANHWRHKDSQFDLVFIDALHDYESVMKDISLWWPKVRKGGVLAGHDFNHKWPGVERAVADHFNLMGVGVGFDSVWFVIKQ
jgi:predicted O-methyltransferase YrrM